MSPNLTTLKANAPIRAMDEGVLDSAPADFDPTAHPIIACHFFGIEPLRPIGVIISPVIQRFESLREATDARA